MCKIRRIDEFLAEWPKAEWGPGHCVLSDANIADCDLDWSLSQLDSLLDGTPWPAETGLWASLYDDHPRDELFATRAFLRSFREIPPAERVEAGDVLCPA